LSVYKLSTWSALRSCTIVFQFHLSCRQEDNSSSILFHP